MILVLLLPLLSLETALCEDAKGSGFQGAIRQIAEARSRVKSYDVTITGKVDSRLERVRLTDGSLHEIEKTPVGFTLNMAFDKEQAKLLVVRNDTYRLKSTGELQTNNWNVFGRTLAAVPQGERWTTGHGRFIGTQAEFFDPLGLGLGFEGEFRRGDPWENIVANYSQWRNDFQTRSLADGKVEFKDEQFSIVIDTKHDQWPISMTSRDTKEIKIKTNLTLANIDGQWLPKTGTVISKDETTDLSFQWHSVNQPIPKARFTSADLEARYGIAAAL